MDRQAIARAQRRRQALEALDYERMRAAAIREQLEAIVAELEGPAIDASIFAEMALEDVEIVRPFLGDGVLADPEEEVEWLSADPDAPEPDPAEQEIEIARLQEEIASSLRRLQAFERYLSALGE